jgi:hypothetical protein
LDAGRDSKAVPSLTDKAQHMKRLLGATIVLVSSAGLVCGGYYLGFLDGWNDGFHKSGGKELRLLLRERESELHQLRTQLQASRASRHDPPESQEVRSKGGS